MSVPELVCYFLPGCWAFPFLAFRGQKGIQWMSNITSATKRNLQGTGRGISLLADVCSTLGDALQKQCHRSFPMASPASPEAHGVPEEATAAGKNFVFLCYKSLRPILHFHQVLPVSISLMALHIPVSTQGGDPKSSLGSSVEVISTQDCL